MDPHSVKAYDDHRLPAESFEDIQDTFVKKRPVGINLIDNDPET